MEGEENGNKEQQVAVLTLFRRSLHTSRTISYKAS
jgi:hypothetical protein